MGIQWNKSLETGISVIDDQHKTWFEKADKLFEAGKEGKSKEYILELFDFLDEYTKIHFKDEEKYMKTIGYPETSNQIEMHKGFVNKLSDIRKEYAKDGMNISVVITTNQFIIDWLIKHITIQDKKIGEFRRKNNI